VRNRWFCPTCNQVVERHELLRGFKQKFATFTDAESDALEAEANKSIDLKEFVPVAKIDPVYFESVYYLGPEEGGEKPYRLLAIALTKTQRAAVARVRHHALVWRKSRPWAELRSDAEGQNPR
jgi:DNA end-binding protein Ku